MMRFGFPRELRDAASADPPTKGMPVPTRPARLRNERLVIDMDGKFDGAAIQVKRQPIHPPLLSLFVTIVTLKSHVDLASAS